MYNFLCVGGDKYGCSSFVAGSNGKIVTVEEALESDPNIPLCWAGAHKETLYRHCLENNRKFYNLDTGYFGNTKRKDIVRVSINNFQNCDPIKSRPNDRWTSLNIPTGSLSRGSSIVVVPPDPKKLKALGLGTVEEWVDAVLSDIKKYTDRPIRVRYRPPSRRNRVGDDSFLTYIDNTWCVVGHSSNALVEAAMHDIPVISLGHSATKSLYTTPLSDIELIKPVHQELKQDWLNHLAYSQFHKDELLSGKAWELLTSEPSSIRSGT
jgi:hypothetical protein